MNAILLSILLLAAPPASDETLDHRMQIGRVGAMVTFIVATAGLGLLMKHLGKQARTAEDEARLEQAFREIEDGLGQPDHPTKPIRPARPTPPTQPNQKEI